MPRKNHRKEFVTDNESSSALQKLMDELRNEKKMQQPQNTPPEEDGET